MDDIMEESESIVNRDRLSELPLSLILHILSFLPIQNAVSTTLLSKHWKNLWTTVPCINIYDYIDEYYEKDRIRNFVNRALIFWKGEKIRKLNIDLKSHFDMSLSKDIDLWVRFAKEKDVEELYIHLAELEILNWENAVIGSEEDVYMAPQCVNSCSSIKKLSLVGCNLQRIHGSLNWSQLRSLRIDGFWFSESSINQVLRGAPKLEVFKLRLLESCEKLNIWSRSLKKLKIEKCLYFDCADPPSTGTVLRIWCPNLKTLEISGILFSECLLMDVSSLNTATIVFYDSYYNCYGLSVKELLGGMLRALRQIFPSIGHVERLALSDCCVQVLCSLEKKCLLSPLSNVKFLQLDVSFIELDKMVDLLGSFPKLKTLVVRQSSDIKTAAYRVLQEQPVKKKYLECEKNLPGSFVLQLRTIEITSPLLETSPVFPFIEILLKRCSMLEKMVIRASKSVSSIRESLLLATEKLLSMPRSSPTAKVIFLRK